MKIVSLSWVVPHEASPTAGAEYVFRHIQALTSMGHDVSVIAPGTPENCAILATGKNVCPTLLSPTKERTRWGRSWHRLRRAWRSIYPDSDFLNFLLEDPEALRRLRSADKVEAQRTEYFAGLSSLPTTATVGVAHDVLTQKYWRRWYSHPWKVIWLVKLMLVFIRERTLLRLPTSVITFSAKDATMLSRLFARDAVVIGPPLANPSMPTTHDLMNRRSVDGDVVLFVGAFSRPENADGAQWLLEEVWPQVRSARPTAQLILAGSGPPEWLVARAIEDPSIQVTGYVESLEPYYTRTSVVVVPIFQGAGVKFKTLTAMLWGVPLVTTPVGAEGLPIDNSSALAVTSDPLEFAQAIIRGLGTSSPEVKSVVIRAYELAHDIAGLEQFSSALGDVYASN